jgi:hypothetical protein
MAVPAILPIGGAVAAIVALLLAVKKSKEGGDDTGGDTPGGGGGGGGGSKPSGGGSKPSGGKKPTPETKFRRGPGGIGWVFGTGDVPPGFKFGSNAIFVSSDCELVVLGEMFWPGPEALPPKQGPTAIERETLDETLAVAGNTAVGFVDYLLAQEGLEQPEEVAMRILAEASPFCHDMPAASWPAGFRDFHEWLLIRCVPYVDEWVHGIDFGGGE